jgi:hypothetical protein
VGCCDGFLDGPACGLVDVCSIGFTEGIIEGALLGVAVGFVTGVVFKGLFTGSTVGAAKGFIVGEFVEVGISVGLKVSTTIVGTLVIGDWVGNSIWSLEGCNVGFDFGSTVGGFGFDTGVTGIIFVGLDVGTAVVGLLVVGESVGESSTVGVLGFDTGAALKLGLVVGRAFGDTKGFADGEFVTGIIFVGLDVGTAVVGLLVVGESVGGSVWSSDGCNVSVELGSAVVAFGLDTGAELEFGVNTLNGDPIGETVGKVFEGEAIGFGIGRSDGEVVAAVGGGDLFGLAVGLRVSEGVGIVGERKLVVGAVVGDSAAGVVGSNVGLLLG